MHIHQNKLFLLFKIQIFLKKTKKENYKYINNYLKYLKIKNNTKELYLSFSHDDIYETLFF